MPWPINIRKAQLEELKRQNAILKEQLKESASTRDAFLTLTLNTIGDPFFIKDQDSRLLYMNDAFCEIFGLSREDIVGKTLAENVAPEEMKNFLAIDQSVLQTGVEKIQVETLTVRDQATKTISTRKSRFVDSQGNKFLVGIIRDITEQHQTLERLQQSEMRLNELNQAKDRIFSIIAHDLRSPLGSVLSLASLLHDDASRMRADEVTEIVGMISNSVRNTLGLLDNLLSWSRSQTGRLKVNPQTFSLADLVKKVYALNEDTAKIKQLRLLDYVADETKVYTDLDLLQIVLQNLVTNAIKFSFPHGQIAISAFAEGEEMLIQVSDLGRGMDAEECAQLFHLTTNTSKPGTNNEKGSGLGLILCHELMLKLGGSIAVQSAPGVGSTFTLRLPTSKG